jgi:ADP-ribose pyrophosphatase YjhB (NUDIX family)
MSNIDRLNVRVYGILFNDKEELLLSKEEKGEQRFTKFPGGGLELGEGILDCLKREFMEEVGVNVEVEAHFYTTEFFQRSAFREADQLISIYYLLRSEESDQIAHNSLAKDAFPGEMNRLVWRGMEFLKVEDLTYPIDRLVAQQLIERYRNR